MGGRRGTSLLVQEQYTTVWVEGQGVKKQSDWPNLGIGRSTLERDTQHQKPIHPEHRLRWSSHIGRNAAVVVSGTNGLSQSSLSK